VRGKAGTPVEFGAKLSVSYHNGYVFIDRLSWDNFNESGDLKSQAEDFKLATGNYPESLHVDQIYRTKENRARQFFAFFCISLRSNAFFVIFEFG
jgi:transposase, IS5 family